MRAAGLDIDLADNHGGELPPALDLSAYRVVQEGLTNVLVHSAARRATVTIARDNGTLELTVCDGGVSAPSEFGAGLTGMRERVALLGGELEAGPADPGWRLQVRLPLHGNGT
jgi:signal transduction histidine kinase